MSDAARRSNNGKRDDNEDPSRVSGPHPTNRGYDPWPIGSEAFATPLAPTPSEPPRFSRRARLGWSIVGIATGAGVGALALAFLFRPATPHAASAEAAHVELSARAVEPEPAPANAAPIEARAAQPEPAREVQPEPAREVQPEPAIAAQPEPARATQPDPAKVAATEASSTTAAPPAQASPSASAARESHTQKDAHKHDHAHNSKLPQQPERTQVIAAMNAVRPAVLACFGDSRGTATANLRIAGASGRITSVQVSGQAGRVGSCIARAVRGAHFPRFATDSLAISYPFAR